MSKNTLLFLTGVFSLSILFGVGEGIAQPYTLTINELGGGSGAVTSSPPGINCPGDCSEAYSAGKRVTLKAKPSSDSYFAGWSGGGCSGTKTCNVTMDSDRTVMATFEKKAPKISVSANQLDFGQVKVGINAQQKLTISNIGTADLHAAIEVTGDFFSIKGKSNITIKPGRSYKLGVTFQPEPEYPEIDKMEAHLLPDGTISVEGSTPIKSHGNIHISSENEGLDISMDGTYWTPEESLSYTFCPEFKRDFEYSDSDSKEVSKEYVYGWVILDYLGTVKTSAGEESYYYGEGGANVEVDVWTFYYQSKAKSEMKGKFAVNAQIGARRTKTSMIIDVVKIEGSGKVQVCKYDNYGSTCSPPHDYPVYYSYENNGGDHLKCGLCDGCFAVEGGECYEDLDLKLCNKYILHILQQ